MANEKNEKAKEPTYAQKLLLEGWNNFFVSATAKDLENPNRDYGTIGFMDPHENKQVFVTIPAQKWLDILTEFAKKRAK